MKIASAFALSLLSVWGANSFEIADEEIASIVGGTPAGSSISYLVSLRKDDDHWCGASLITPRVLLTSADCMYGDIGITNFDPPTEADFNRYRLDDNRGVVRMFFEDLTKNGDSILEHPNFNPTTLDNNFALMFLPNAIEGVSPVQLNSDPNVPGFNGRPLHVAGWGYTTDGGGVFSNIIRELDYFYIDNGECRDRNYNDADITSSMLCATSNQDQGVCRGDDGGPLVLGSYAGGPADGTPVQVGVVHFRYPEDCADTIGFPDVYSRVSSAIDWIRRSVCSRTGEMCFPTSSPTPQSTPAVTI